MKKSEKTQTINKKCIVETFWLCVHSDQLPPVTLPPRRQFGWRQKFDFQCKGGKQWTFFFFKLFKTNTPSNQIICCDVYETECSKMYGSFYLYLKIGLQFMFELGGNIYIIQICLHTQGCCANQTQTDNIIFHVKKGWLLQKFSNSAIKKLGQVSDWLEVVVLSRNKDLPKN